MFCRIMPDLQEINGVSLHQLLFEGHQQVYSCCSVRVGCILVHLCLQTMTKDGRKVCHIVSRGSTSSVRMYKCITQSVYCTFIGMCELFNNEELLQKTIKALSLGQNVATQSLLDVICTLYVILLVNIIREQKRWLDPTH